MTLSGKLTPLLTIVLVLLGMICILGGCQEEGSGDPGLVEGGQPNPENPAKEKSSKNEKPKEAKPIQQFFDYRLVESNAGIRQWILVSDVMNKYAGQRDAELVTVHLDFYKNGEHFSTLTSDSGSADLNTKDIFTWGNVVVVTDDGRKLETEELYFDNETQLIHNDVFDRFTREDDVIEGIGLEATPDLEYIEIKQQVEADVLDSENIEGEAR